MPVEIIPQDQMLQQVGKKFEPTPWITVDQEGLYRIGMREKRYPIS